MAVSDMLRVVRLLANHGTRVLVITGGEPTLISDLPIVLREVKALGMKSVLSSNGLLIGPRMDEIVSNLDWLALPLDGPTADSNGRMREGSSQHFTAVLDLLVKIRARYPRLKIKLGTVVTRLNVSEVSEIPRILPPDALPDVWKLYQFSPSSYGKDNRLSLEIGADEFEAAVANARRAAERLNLRLAVYRNSERDGKYLFIEPTGEAVVIHAGAELAIGNILNDPEGVLDTWPGFVDEQRLQSNADLTYP
jgi:MoaA/NifB/PqqE/SkfB family radical SAM enzyme